MSSRRGATPGVRAQGAADDQKGITHISVRGAEAAVKPVRKLYDFRCEMTPAVGLDSELLGKPLEEMALAYDRWASQFNVFLAEHTEYRGARVDIRRDIRDACSDCGAQWETDTIHGVLACASCGKPVLVDVA